MVNFNYVSNQGEINKNLQSILEEVIEKVSHTLLEDFQQHLEETVYAPLQGDYKRYHTKGGFYEGWNIKVFEKYVRGLVFEGNRLISPSEDMINSQMSHGGSNGGDQRGKMPWILNNSDANETYSYSGGAYYLRQQSEGYWDSYMKDIDKKVTKWLDNEFKKYGISRR